MILVSILNLVLQTVAFAAVIVGVILVKRGGPRAIKRHLYATTAAMILLAVSVALVMLPSFVLYFSSPPGVLTSFGVISTAGHAFVGGLVFVIGIAFIVNKKPKSVKLWMQIQASLWFIAFLLGIIEFLQVLAVI
jgi:uncharacterized membrane protein YozB (DUF420 family)